MPERASTLQPSIAAGQPACGSLTPEGIERILARFRDWIGELPTVRNEPGANGALEPGQASVQVDLQTLVGQFVALRHEVNLQTKSTRASLEQNATTLQQLEEAVAEMRGRQESDSEPTDSSEELRPLLKAVVDVYDALALAARQVERQKDNILAGLETVLEVADIEPPPETAAPASTGFWQRVMGSSDRSTSADSLVRWRERTLLKIQERQQRVHQATGFVRQALEGLLTGYTMSLNRIERVLPQFGVVAIECLGEDFDPDFMEVVEAVPQSGRRAGEVLEEVRRGYIWKETVFRYAQVRVAR
jgi:molecular chaperone GrpE